MSYIIPSLFAFIGIIIGASLQYIFGQVQEERTRRQNLKVQAYTDLLRGIAGVAISRKMNDEKKAQEFITLLTEARMKIAICGAPNVVHYLADFWRLGEMINSSEQESALVMLCKAMRQELSSLDKHVIDKDMSVLLFGD